MTMIAPTKIPTLRDVASAAGVDASTASLALRGHPRIPTATRERIRNAADKIGYRPDPALGRLAARRWLGKRGSETATLAYLAQIHQPTEGAAPQDRYLHGAMDQAARLGYQIDIFNPQDYPNDSRLSDVIYARGIRGLIVGQRTSLDREHHLAWQRFCIVQAGLNLPTDVLTLVRCDLDAALRQAHARLQSAGYRRILIYLIVMPGAASDRILVETLKHLPPSAPGRVWTAIVDRWDDFLERQPSVLAQIRAWRPDAVLTLHQGNISFWQEAGLKIPKEFAAACLNLEPGTTDFAGMNLQMEQIGAAAVDLVDTKLRRFEYGVPSSRFTVTIDPVWVPGPSLPEPALRAPGKRRSPRAQIK